MGKNPAGLKDRFQDSHLAQAWLVLVLAVSFGAALAFVQIKLGGIIAANKLNETLAQVPELVWGENMPSMADPTAPVKITPGSISVSKENKTSSYPLFQVIQGDAIAGWVIKAGGQGYADKIEALIGLDAEAKIITGLFVLEQKETPGLGNNITRPVWRSQFVGKRTDAPLEVKKTPTEASHAIDAVTGATISSVAVTGIVNRTVDDIRGRLTPEFIRLKTGGQP